jgi:hypothetical protein
MKRISKNIYAAENDLTHFKRYQRAIQDKHSSLLGKKLVITNNRGILVHHLKLLAMKDFYPNGKFSLLTHKMNTFILFSWIT